MCDCADEKREGVKAVEEEGWSMFSSVSGQAHSLTVLLQWMNYELRGMLRTTPSIQWGDPQVGGPKLLLRLKRPHKLTDILTDILQDADASTHRQPMEPYFG